MASVTRFFHGGLPGLRAGATILPAAETGVLSRSGDTGAPYRRDRVYLTTSQREARSYARLYAEERAARRASSGGVGRGAVYEVVPVGTVEADGDYADHTGRLSWEATRATIVARVETVAYVRRITS